MIYGTNVQRSEDLEYREQVLRKGISYTYSKERENTFCYIRTNR